MPTLEMHVPLASLWLPILISAAAVWIASFLVWSVLPLHKNDFKSLPDEPAFTAALRGLNIPAGNYGFPDCKGSNRKDPEFVKRWKEGPSGMLNIWPPISMGRNMVLTFVVYLVMSLLVAYIGSLALARGADKASAFRLLGAAGVLGYGFSFLPQGIWFAWGRRALIQGLLDGIAYGLITGGVFALMWPR
jgi:hypothetical protein